MTSKKLDDPKILQVFKYKEHKKFPANWFINEITRDKSQIEYINIFSDLTSSSRYCRVQTNYRFNLTYSTD